MSEKKIASSTSTLTTAPKARTLSVRSVASSLHKRILKKNTTSRSEVTQLKQLIREDPSAPPQEPQVDSRLSQHLDIPLPLLQTASEGSAPSTSIAESSSAYVAAVDRVGNWEQCGISPPKELRLDGAELDSVSELSNQTPPARNKRVSMLIAHCPKQTGVEMDMATKVANDALQRGKDALEASTNVKREIKMTAIESLQALYEIVLSLADSRHRHIAALERERTRHASELLFAERAHIKSVTTTQQNLLKEVALARDEIAVMRKETQAIRDWQSYETREPYQQIKATAEAVSALSGQKKNELATPCIDIEPLRRDYSGLKIGVETLQRQIDELRRESRSEKEKTTEILQRNAEALANLLSNPPPPPPQYLDSFKELEKTLKEHLKKDHVTLPLPTPVQINIEEHVLPITERLEAVSSELRTMRKEKNSMPPPALSIGEELSQAKVGRLPKPTYAKVAAKPSAPRPNHTLIVSTLDTVVPTTAENLIDRIRVALDTRTTGAKVDRVRKARNRKIILSCGTEEDLSLVRSCVQQDTSLKVETAKAGNPLIIIRDVLSYHGDSEIVENLLAQNKHLLQGVDLKESTVRVRYRKMARNPHECHPVLEVSPRIHRSLVDAGKVYIGLQRRPVSDHSPLVQCTKCLGFGHTKAICREREELCSHCGNPHSWAQCKARKEGLPPKCRNCATTHPISSSRELAHNAFSSECPEKAKWDGIARSRISYC